MKFGSILLTRPGKGTLENCIMVSHTSSTSNAASYMYAMLFECTTGCQHAIATAVCRPTILLQVQSVLIMLSVQRVCVLWNSSFVCDSIQPEVHVNTRRQCKNRKNCIPAIFWLATHMDFQSHRIASQKIVNQT